MWELSCAARTIQKTFGRGKDFTVNIHGWCRFFLKRHPGLTRRRSQTIGNASANTKYSQLVQWHNNLRKQSDDLGFGRIWEDPTRIFNTDECPIRLVPSDHTVIIQKGSKHNMIKTPGAIKSHTTALFTACASGEMLQPLLLWKGAKVPAAIVNRGEENGIKYLASRTGWMTQELLCFYIEFIFHPELVERKAKFPVILIADGAACHRSLVISKLCKRLEIILVILFPNSTHITQPLDVRVFGAMKKSWHKLLNQKQLSCRNFVATKENLPILLGQLLKELYSTKPVKTVVAAFRVSFNLSS